MSKSFDKVWLVGGAALALLGVYQVGCFPFSPGECLNCDTESGSSSTTGTGGGATTTTTTTTTSTTGTAGSCAADEVCAPSIAGAYVTLAESCDSGVTALDLLDCGACACTGTPTCRAMGGYYTNDACDQGLVTIDTDTACQNTNDVPGPVYVKATVTAGGCAPETADPPQTACPIAMPAPCGMGGTCVPTTACVLVLPNATCPDGYEERAIQQGGTCGCACDAGCPPEVRLYDNNNCMGTATTVIADNTCREAVGLSEARAVRGPDTAGLTCTPSATPTNATRKLCCPPE